MNLKHITTTILLSIVIGLSFNTVYADVVELPILPTSNMVGIDVQNVYQSDNRYKIVITVQYQVDKAIEVPTIISWIDITGEVHTINLQEDFIVVNTPFVASSIEEEDPPTKEEIYMEEKKLERQAIEDELVLNALKCIYGDEERGNSVYQSYRETLINEKLAYFKHLPEDYQTRQMTMWTEECRVFEESYLSDNPRYADMAKAQRLTDIQPWDLDDSDMPGNEPVTAEDMEREAQEAQDYKCSELGKQRGLCAGEFSGDIYVKPEPTMPFWYQNYLRYQDVSSDLQTAMEESMITQCEVYYPKYTASGSYQIPAWLEHCVEAEN